jgi:diamine N-acetyltransferase
MIPGKRVRLCAIERTDLPRFVTWLNDPEVIRGMLMVSPMSMAQEEGWFERLKNRPVEEHPLLIQIYTDEGWLPIGNIGLHNLNWISREAEVGIVIGEKQFWSQGYGADAMRLMLRHAFNHLNLNRVFLHVYSNNPRAVRSYEKAGFVHEGRLRQAQYREGQYVDILVMSVLRSEWKDQEV